MTALYTATYTEHNCHNKLVLRKIMLIMAEQQVSSTLYVLPKVSPENNILNVIKMPMSTTTKNTIEML